jgi:hypothetical protein
LRCAQRRCRPAPAHGGSGGSTACQHPLQGQLVHQLGGGECLPGRQRELPGAVGAAHPRPIDPEPPAAEGDLTGLGTVTHRAPMRVVAALRPDQPGDVGGRHDLQHLQARPDRQGEQALAGNAGQLGNRNGHLLRQLELGKVGRDGAVGILRHGGPFWSSFLADARHLPHGRHQAGTATSTSTGTGTTSRVVPACSCVVPRSWPAAIVGAWSRTAASEEKEDGLRFGGQQQRVGALLLCAQKAAVVGPGCSRTRSAPGHDAPDANLTRTRSALPCIRDDCCPALLPCLAIVARSLT